jgi:hypothetical protein
MKAVMQKQGHSDERKKDSIIQSFNQSITGSYLGGIMKILQYVLQFYIVI